MVRNNPKVSWESLAAGVDQWCSAATIRQWMTTRAVYKLYDERIITFLSKEPKGKNMYFEKRYRKNWGLGPRKYLLVIYDEKWFWGLVTRKGAKMCVALGINTHTFRAYYKSHINKTMGIEFTDFAFENSIENGGEAVKLAFIRAQPNKISQKRRFRDETQADGSVWRVIERDIGYPWLVDCCVTGSSCGTDSNPKFHLLSCFRENIFPILADLVGVGGKYEGYTPII